MELAFPISRRPKFEIPFDRLPESERAGLDRAIVQLREVEQYVDKVHSSLLLFDFLHATYVKHRTKSDLSLQWKRCAAHEFSMNIYHFASARERVNRALTTAEDSSVRCLMS